MSNFEKRIEEYLVELATEIASETDSRQIKIKARSLSDAIAALDDYQVNKEYNYRNLNDWLAWNWKNTPKAVFLEWL